ncbi:ArsR family transcriptional regulator [Halobacteriales archaeon SW_12_71_31]|nr:MAG: ArsR family transcriptional regulator [Halobacteriales archaeon SW_12_71_31]
MTDADLYETREGDDLERAPEAVTDLPPSSKLVYKTLVWNGRLTQQEIIERSLLSARTVRDALSRLEEHDVVERNVYYRDARQNVYTLADRGRERGSGTEPDRGAAAVE